MIKELMGSLFAIVVALVAATQVSALTTEPWTMTVVGGPFDGAVGTGSFTYEESALLVGDETLDPIVGGLTLDITILSQTFFEVDDIDFNAFPQLEFANFEPVSVNFIVEDGVNGVDITEPDVVAIIMASPLTPMGAGGFEGFAIVEMIPEPQSLALLTLLLGSFVMNSRPNSQQC